MEPVAVGNTDINALKVGITYEGVVFPILFSLLSKRGDANMKVRIDIIDLFIKFLVNLVLTILLVIACL